MTRNKKIDIIGAMIVVGLILSIGQTLVSFADIPNIYVFMATINRHGDFVYLNEIASRNSPYAAVLPDAGHFPFLFRIAHLFALMRLKYAVIAFYCLFIGFFLFYCYKGISVRNAATDVTNILLFSFGTYPFLFALNRGNYEMMVFILIALFVWSYQCDMPLLGPVLLASAIAMKPFSAFFLLLFLSDRRFKDIVYVIVTTSTATLLSYCSFEGGGGTNLRLHQASMDAYITTYALNNTGLGYGSSLFGMVKIFIAYCSPESLTQTTRAIFGSYSVLAVIVTCLVGSYMWVCEQTFWKKIALIVFCMNLLPHVSADYRLLYVFIPLFLFINSPHEDKHDLTYVVLFGLLLLPKYYYYFVFESSANVVPYSVSTSGILNPMLMILCGGVIITSGIRTHRKARYPGAE